MRMNLQTCLVVAAVMLAGAHAFSQDNPILDHLLSVGVPLDEDTVIKLPPPSLKRGLTKAEEQRVLDSVRGRRPLSEFVRKSRVTVTGSIKR